MKYVIIGNGPAAATAAETIRRADDAGEITLLSKEDEFTYSRPLISYLLCGKTDETRMRYKPADFYARNRVDFRAGVAAVSIDKDEKTVTVRTATCTPMTSCCWRRARSRWCRRFRGWKAYIITRS